MNKRVADGVRSGSGWWQVRATAPRLHDTPVTLDLRLHQHGHTYQAHPLAVSIMNSLKG